MHTGKRGRPPLKPTPGVGLVQAVKRRRKGRVVGVDGSVVIGELVDCPYAVHQERFHGALRDRLACLTRKTHAFAEKVETRDAAVILAIFESNGLRPHRALQERAEDLPKGGQYRHRTPAMAVGMTDPIWSWEGFLTHRPRQCYRE